MNDLDFGFTSAYNSYNSYNAYNNNSRYERKVNQVSYHIKTKDEVRKDIAKAYKVSTNIINKSSIINLKPNKQSFIKSILNTKNTVVVHKEELTKETKETMIVEDNTITWTDIQNE